MVLGVDLVINFIATDHSAEDVQKAAEQYSRLLNTLTAAGLRAVGRRGSSSGRLLIFVKATDKAVHTLAKRERRSDFLSGVPIAESVTPADRIRLVHEYVTSITDDGGLGITPRLSDWDLVESIMCLHDRKFNDKWIHAWTRKKIISVTVDSLHDHFGDSVALYFSFLQFYTNALWFPSILGVVCYFCAGSYSLMYSFFLLLWSVIFVEWWRVRERLLSLEFATYGSFRVEKLRAQHTPGFQWWNRELRMLVSLPVILLFACVLIIILTGVFIFEAFVSQLYTGPWQKFIDFAPTVLIAVLLPRLLDVYQASLERFTAWENHAHESSHVASLTRKTFALSTLVAYLGLALTAFVYVPFGEGLMRFVHQRFSSVGARGKAGVWIVDASRAMKKIDPERLRDEMFAYVVTNQIMDSFSEIGLPFFSRAFERFRKGWFASLGEHEPREEALFSDDEKEMDEGEEEERRFLESVKKEAALPELDLFAEYDEMVTQFGYVALWSAIWPLAPVMALINNYVELRSDAFKITVHARRPMPSRTDTIGPWLDGLTFLTWLAAVTNSVLVYLFYPLVQDIEGVSITVHKMHLDLVDDLALRVLVIALAASHGYMLLRVLVRHVLEQLVWKTNEKVTERTREERKIKESFLKDETGSAALLGTHLSHERRLSTLRGNGGLTQFWDFDEGLEEIETMSKEE